MKIKDMLTKEVTRDIRFKKSIFHSDNMENVIHNIDNLTFTNTVLENLLYFFNFYNESLVKINKSNLAWVIGDNGTGKSSFLLILYYILNTNLRINGETLFEIIKKSEKINDKQLIKEIEKFNNFNRDVILCNGGYLKSNHSILDFFVNKFNEIRGYSSSIPFLAYFEKQLDLKNYYASFKKEFEKIEGSKWIDVRDEFYFIFDSIIKSVENIGFMSKSDCECWFKELEDYKCTIDEFCNEINQYCENNNNYHVIFLIDDLNEIIIGDDSIIEFKNILNELYLNCSSNVFIIVSSYLHIDDILFSTNNDSNVFDYFTTVLLFDFDNIIEVAKMQLLSKNEPAIKVIETHMLNESNIFNSKYFENTNFYHDDFINSYPFISYQFKLFMEIFQSYMHFISSIAFVEWGETRDLFCSGIQQLLEDIQENDESFIVSFDLFFNILDLMASHSMLFNNLEEDELLSEFDLKLLKVIFMLGFSNNIKATSSNLTTLMISNINENLLELNKKVKTSLDNLINLSLIEKNGVSYIFVDEY